MEYSIRHVFDEETGETYDAKFLFRTISGGQEFRKAFHSGNQILRCQECKERATVFTKPNGRVFFRHFPNTPYCSLKDPGFTQAERKEIEEYIANRESDRHKDLKRQLGDYLRNVMGVDANTITVDDHYLKDQREKRRPDVYCEFNSLKIAFEVQLSRLPAKYIFKRHDFYSRNEIYLMWVLDKFEPNGSTQTERDIKYLNAHQNYFCFDDYSNPQTIKVQFKTGLINSKNKAYYPWQAQSVSLQELQFDASEFQIYFISFADEKLKTEQQIGSELIQEKIEPAVILLREFYKTDKEAYIPYIENEIDNLDFEEFNSLNQRICGTDNSDLFYRLLVGAGKPHFFKYILESVRFNKNLNAKNSERKNLLEVVLSHPNLLFKTRIVQLMFAEGYKLSQSDKVYITSCVIPYESKQEREMRIIKIHAYNFLKSLDLIELYDKIEGTLMTILTAKHNRIIGFGFKNFIEVANNAIHNYKTTWTYIWQAFTYYKLWDELIQRDRKGTFQEKLLAHQSSNVEKYSNAERILIKLFPEVFNPSSIKIPWFHLEMIE